MTIDRAWRGVFLSLLLLLPAVAAARTTEVHLVIKVDMQRTHPGAPPDEPIEPAPAIQDRARDLAASHPVFRDVTTRIVVSETPPNPRVPADFLRLVDAGVDDVVVVDLSYYLRLDGFRATGRAGVQGYVAVLNVAGRRKVASRQFTVSADYPGEVSKEAVIQAELAARARGGAVPIEEVELGLLDAAVKERLGRELGAALGIYHPASLPPLSKQAIDDAMSRMALLLADSPDRRPEAIQMLGGYLTRHPDSPQRAQLQRRLETLRRAAPRDPGQDRVRQQERAAVGVTRTVTAAELADVFERLIGSKVEVRAFKLDWRDSTVVMTPTDKNQPLIVEGAPLRVRDLDVEPSPIYVLVVGRQPNPSLGFLDVPIPVVRWVGCPKAAACPE